MATGMINFSTVNGTTDFVKKSFAGMITRLMPNGQAPLFGLTSMLKDETAVQVEHGFFTKTMVFPNLNLDAAVADGAATTFTVASTANVLPGMLMRAQSTGEVVLILTVPSGTSVTVRRGVGTIAAAAIADNVNFYQVGNAFEEGSSRPSALSIQAVRVTNLTQIFRNSWALTDTARATQVIAGDTNMAESRSECAAFHAVDMEKAIFFAQKYSGTLNSQPIRTMDGLINQVTVNAAANVNTAGATTNYTQLEALLDVCFNTVTDPKVANERVLFCGGAAKRVLNNIGRLNGTYQLVDGQTSYGLQFSSFKTSRGTFRMIEHPLFNSNVDWAKMAVAVDLSSFNLAYLGDRKTQSSEYGANGQALETGVDAVGGSLTTEMTCLVKNPAANAIIYGLTAAAAG
jgi:hypothetical protein